MNENKNLWPRLGGYLILLIVIFWLLRGWRASVVEGTAVSSTTSTTNTPIATTRQPATNDGQQLTLDALPVISDTALYPEANPQTFQGKQPQHEFQTYVVKRGDTPNGIAEKFGIAPETLLFGSIRWVDWSEFEISPPNYPLGTLVDYQEDWTTYTLGIGRRFSDKWSGAIQVSHEPAAAYLPFTTLGPVDGRTSIGVAATYTEGHMKITTGITYVDLGETANLVNTQFSGGDAVGIGVRIGYTF